MYKSRSDSNVSEKFKSYVTGIMMKNFISLTKIDKYFRMDISESMSKAIEENWIRILGIDYEIISLNLSKNNKPLGIALEGRNVQCADSNDVVQRHFLKVIIPNLCIGSTKRFMIGDELLEVNGLKIFGMLANDVVSALKKLPNNIQIVVARSHLHNVVGNEDSDDTEFMNEPISFYDMDEDITSRTCTLKSNSSLFSATSRDYGSTASVGDHFDGHNVHVSEYLRDIIGWRGPIVLEFRKEKRESLGLAIEEIKDPKSSDLIIVFKIIVPGMRAANDGRLHVGDRLLQVNGKSVVGTSFRKVCQWMKTSSGGRLILYICKPHFPTLTLDTNDYYPDRYLTDTLSRSDKLPKLSEEPDKDNQEIPPVPDTVENRLVIKRINDKLGLYLDIVDNGKNGCRIKKIVKGQAKDNGMLHEGDHITSINGLSMRIDEKNKLEHCLRIIAKSSTDYEIHFFTKEDVDLHKSKFRASNKGLYPNAAIALSNTNEDSPVTNNSYEQATNPKLSFETYNVTIDNDYRTNLGLILSPSLNNPNRYISITDIHPDSLSDNSQLLKINDELLSVNNRSLEGMTPTNVGMLLKKLLQTEDCLRLKIMRLISTDDVVNVDTSIPSELTNQYPLLSDLPDMYFCTLRKSHFGYGLSVKELPMNYGVVVNEIEPGSPADNEQIIIPGHRFMMINNSFVCDYLIDDIVKMVKNARKSISLIMETPKYREFNVEVMKDNSNSLGLNVGGGIDTKFPFATIESMVLNSSCQFTEKLQPGDIIADVNGTSMVNLDHGAIINVLRTLPKESVFKCWRLLPLIKRNFSMIDSPSFIDNYLQSCQFSVIINKPISSIASFGINFGDIVIVDPCSHVVLDRYKVVISIEQGSLFEKYAPEVKPYCFLISVNDTIVDVDMACDQLRSVIDSVDHVELVFSRDIPYRITVPHQSDCPIIVESIVESSDYDNIRDKDQSAMDEAENKHVHFVTSPAGSGASVSTECPREPDAANIVQNEMCHVSEGNTTEPGTASSDQYNGTEQLFTGNVDEESPQMENNACDENKNTSINVRPLVSVELSSKNEYEGLNERSDNVSNSSSNQEYIEDDKHEDNIIAKETLNEIIIDNEDFIERKNTTASIEMSSKDGSEVNYPATKSDEVIKSGDLRDREVIEDKNIFIEGRGLNEEPEESHQENDQYEPLNIEPESSNKHNEDYPHDQDKVDDKNNFIVNEKHEDIFEENEKYEPLNIETESSNTHNEDYPHDQDKVDDKNNFIDNACFNETNEDTPQKHDHTKTGSSINDPCDQESVDAAVIDKANKTDEDICDDSKIEIDNPKSHENEEIQNFHVETKDSNNEENVDNNSTEEKVEAGNVVENCLMVSDDGIAKEWPEKTLLETDLGITIEHVIIPQIDNVELGFHVIGGIGGGPDGETLPIYVVGIEQHTRNWPATDQGPLLSNGTQLLDLNGRKLSDCDLSTVEKLIASTDGDLKFKVIKMK